MQNSQTSDIYLVLGKKFQNYFQFSVDILKIPISVALYVGSKLSDIRYRGMVIEIKVPELSFPTISNSVLIYYKFNPCCPKNPQCLPSFQYPIPFYIKKPSFHPKNRIQIETKNQWIIRILWITSPFHLSKVAYNDEKYDINVRKYIFCVEITSQQTSLQQYAPSPSTNNWRRIIIISIILLRLSSSILLLEMDNNHKMKTKDRLHSWKYMCTSLMEKCVFCCVMFFSPLEFETAKWRWWHNHISFLNICLSHRVWELHI